MAPCEACQLVRLVKQSRKVFPDISTGSRAEVMGIFLDIAGLRTTSGRSEERNEAFAVLFQEEFDA